MKLLCAVFLKKWNVFSSGHFLIKMILIYVYAYALVKILAPDLK